MYFHNACPPFEYEGDTLNKATVVAWMNEWSDGNPSVPTFKKVEDEVGSDIRVQFTGRCQNDCIDSRG